MNLIGRSFGRCLRNRLLSGYAVVMNFVSNCLCLEIPSDNRIRQIPGCVLNLAQNSRLDAFYYFHEEAVFWDYTISSQRASVASCC
jgi:hypothetical protein